MQNRLLFLTATLLLTSLPALAQSKPESQIFMPPGTNYENRGAKTIQILREQSLQKEKKFPINTVEVSLVHYHYMEPDQFGIMVKVPRTVTGCFDLSPMEYELKFVNNMYMDIDVKEFRRTPVKTQDVTFDCDQKSKAVSGLIVLSAKDLQTRGINQIRFGNGNVRDNYNIEFTPESIHLTPESMVAFKAQNLTGVDKDKMVYYFASNTIVSLQVPMAEESDDVAQAVRDIAYKSALTPIFESPSLDTTGKDHIYYFNDPHGKILAMLETEDYAEFGTINAARPYDGPEGRQTIPVPLKVFVSRPGTKL
jgi:cytochrome c1